MSLIDLLPGRPATGASASVAGVFYLDRWFAKAEYVGAAVDEQIRFGQNVASTLQVLVILDWRVVLRIELVDVVGVRFIGMGLDPTGQTKGQ
ncbi:MAG: hypothetical protein GY789_24105 [Hyphomicrobiales bacterium]|nr:hypothetical protein [Hyphomicrobiales bacterium]MCP5000629.1 hypothetical protein [Hyphomicrobiales bacterium]